MLTDMRHEFHVDLSLATATHLVQRPRITVLLRRLLRPHYLQLQDRVTVTYIARQLRND